MKQVTLKGKTLKGKNRVREHGNLWHVLSVSPGTQFVPRGMLHVEPVSSSAEPTKEARWIHPTADSDFEIVEWQFDKN